MAKKKRVKTDNGEWSFKDYIEWFCNAGVYIFLFFFVAVYAFYAPEGYMHIATNKYRFFKRMCQITVFSLMPLIFLYYTEIFGEKEKTWKEKAGEVVNGFSVTDKFIAAFVITNILTFCLTDFREEALWGTSGWYMGFAMQMIFVGIYFLMSRFYDNRIPLLPIFMVVTGVIFLWGLLNRFSVYPMDMKYNPSFISRLGNINWFCGYWSVFFSIGVVLYLISEKTWLRILSAVSAVISLGTGAMQGSDSGFLAMAAVFFFLFLLSFQRTVYMKRFLETGMLFCVTCQLMRLITVIWPEKLNYRTVLGDLMLGNFTLAVLCISAILWGLLMYVSKKRGEKDKEWITKLKWLRNMVIGLAVGVFILYIVLLVQNTRNPGSIGKLSEYPVVFLFNNHWGSDRGATWTNGIEVYRSLPAGKKLFGAGQDCFAAYAYSMPEMAQYLDELWGGSRLTNAHNECITYLVNTGLFGMLAFIGIFVSSFVRLVRRGKAEPLCYVFAACILSYFIHNQFSFSQVENTPYAFMMLGLGENLLRQKEG